MSTVICQWPLKPFKKKKIKFPYRTLSHLLLAFLSLPPAIVSAQPKQPSSPLPILNLKLPVSCFYCNQPGPSCSQVQSRWHLQEPLNGLSTSTPDPSGLFLTQHSEWSFKNKYCISSLSSKLFWDFPGPQINFKGLMMPTVSCVTWPLPIHSTSFYTLPPPLACTLQNHWPFIHP